MLGYIFFGLCFVIFFFFLIKAIYEEHFQQSPTTLNNYDTLQCQNWSSSKMAIFTLLTSGTAYVANKSCTFAATSLQSATGLSCAASAVVTLGLGTYGFISGILNVKRDQQI